MNWKLTRPGHSVRFECGEPICMIVPFPRTLLGELDPIRAPLSSSPESHERFHRWSHDRDEFHRKVAERDAEAIKQGWQKDYFRGQDPGADVFSDHQTKLSVKPFRRAESDLSG